MKFLVLSTLMAMHAGAAPPPAEMLISQLPQGTKTLFNEEFTVKANPSGAEEFETFYYQSGMRVEWSALNRALPYCFVMFQAKRSEDFLIKTKSAFTVKKPDDDSANYRFYFEEVIGGVTCKDLGVVTVRDFTTAFGSKIVLDLPESKIP